MRRYGYSSSSSSLNFVILTTLNAQTIKGNKEAAIMLAEQVNNVIRVLANRTRDLDGDMPGGYLSDIESLKK